MPRPDHCEACDLLLAMRGDLRATALDPRVPEARVFALLNWYEIVGEACVTLNDFIAYALAVGCREDDPRRFAITARLDGRAGPIVMDPEWIPHLLGTHKDDAMRGACDALKNLFPNPKE